MRRSNKKYANGGTFKDILKVPADLALSGIGLGNVIDDNSYSNEGIGNFTNTAGKVTKAVLPLAANLIAPGSGQFVSMGQHMAGNFNPEDPNMNANMPNQSYELGGQLQEYANDGGNNTHENNMYGGIPVGENLVEGNETRFEDYIFSDRLKVPGKKSTFARMSKRINSKYKDLEHDDLAQESKERELGQLMETQEGVRNTTMKRAFKRAFPDGGNLFNFDNYYKELENWQNPSAKTVPKTIAEAQSKYIVPTIKTYQDTLNKALYEKYKIAPGTQITKEQNYFLDPKEANAALGDKYGDYVKYVNAYQSYRGKTPEMGQRDLSGTIDPNTELYGVRHMNLFNPYFEPSQMQKYSEVKQEADTVKTKTGIMPQKAYGGRMKKYAKGGKIGPEDMDYSSPIPNYYVDPNSIYEPQPTDFMADVEYNNTLNMPAEDPNDFVNIAAGKINPISYRSQNTNTALPVTAEQGNMGSANMDGNSPETSFNPYISGLQMLGPASQLFYGLKGGDKVNYKRAAFQKVNPEASKDLAKVGISRAFNTANASLRNNNLSTSQYMANRLASGTQEANVTAEKLAGIQSNYDNQNAGIMNQQEQINNQIALQESIDRQKELDAARTSVTEGLYGIGANAAGMYSDYNKNNVQNIILRNLRTRNYKLGDGYNVVPTTNKYGGKLKRKLKY